MKFTQDLSFKCMIVLAMALLFLISGCAEPKRKIVEVDSLERDIREIDKGFNVEKILRRNKSVAISAEKDPFKPLIEVTDNKLKEDEIRKEKLVVEKKMPLTLTGIIRGFEEPIAIIEMNKKTYVVKENKELGDYLLEKIGREEVVFVKGDKKFNLKLGEDKSEKK